MPTEPPTRQITQSNELKHSPHLQHNIITQVYEDNPMTNNFIQCQVCYNHPLHLHINLPPHPIDNISLVKHYVIPAIHPETGETITSHKKFVKNLITREIWTEAMAMKLGNTAQGHKVTNTPGTNIVFILDHESIKNMPADRKILHDHIVVDYRPQNLIQTESKSQLEGTSLNTYMKSSHFQQILPLPK